VDIEVFPFLFRLDVGLVLSVGLLLLGRLHVENFKI
jgi:hypothetical protein